LSFTSGGLDTIKFGKKIFFFVPFVRCENLQSLKAERYGRTIKQVTGMIWGWSRRRPSNVVLLRLKCRPGKQFVLPIDKKQTVGENNKKKFLGFPDIKTIVEHRRKARVENHDIRILLSSFAEGEEKRERD